MQYISKAMDILNDKARQSFHYDDITKYSNTDPLHLINMYCI